MSRYHVESQTKEGWKTVNGGIFLPKSDDDDQFYAEWASDYASGYCSEIISMEETAVRVVKIGSANGIGKLIKTVLDVYEPMRDHPTGALRPEVPEPVRAEMDEMIAQTESTQEED